MRRLVAALSVATALALSALSALGAVPAAAQTSQHTAATSTDSVTAASCLGSARSFSKPAGPVVHPEFGELVTTSNCSDIQIRIPQNRFVKVCFSRFTGTSPNCQAGFKSTVANNWTVIATNVRDNTGFYFLFSDDRAVSGQYAA